jgi:tRNA pseudouridine38-40 synthase
MPRYFLELAYKGTNYSGFQSQKNTGKTIQAEIEKAFEILQKDKISLTASSRTDAGVHALQNFFHFDTNSLLYKSRGEGLAHRSLSEGGGETEQFVYKMNALLPDDIVVKKLVPVKEDAHCRFDAISREYKYFIYRHKDPFLKDRAFYFPYKLDLDKLNEASSIIKQYEDFTSFSKRNTQVKTFICQIKKSEWTWKDGCLIYQVKSNRFLRGMVRALTATMLKIGRGKLSIDELHDLIAAKDCTKASFSVPSQGLFLVSVEYPSGYFE